MRIADQIPDKQKQQIEQMKSPKKKRRNKEKLSTKDIEELMGIHQDTYTRRNGAVRRK